MTAAMAHASVPAGVVSALYIATKALHTEAERSGIIGDLLRGEASRDGYILLQRNLLPAYQALEAGLERHRKTPAIATLAAFEFDRATPLTADLRALCGGDFSDIPMLAAGEAYAGRIATAANGSGAALIAHAYTRYLGDLSGGQILKRLLGKKSGLRPEELSFYDFPHHPDLAALKADYRNALDLAGLLASDHAAIIEEGQIAFAMNIDLSEAVRNAVKSVPAGAG